MADFPWYELVTGALEQGDFLHNCLAPVPPALVPQGPDEPPPVAVEAESYPLVVVMTQSCDLADGRLRRVMLCPVWELGRWLEANFTSVQQRNSNKGNLEKGRLVSNHLLNVCNTRGHELSHLVVDFGDAFSVPVEYANKLAGDAERLRLLPPYREHMAQAFARYYMRVGLPVAYDPLP